MRKSKFLLDSKLLIDYNKKKDFTEEKVMFCRNCGKLLPDDAKICPYCRHYPRERETNRRVGEDKHGVGIFLGFFLGLLGLIIGLLLYPFDTDERKTFLAGWIAGFIISIVIAVALMFIAPFWTSCAIYENINYR